MTPSLSSFVLSLVSGSVVLGAIIFALAFVSTKDLIIRD